MPGPHPHDQSFPVAVLASTDPVLRESVAFGLVMDAPGVVVVRHDVLAKYGAVRRVVTDGSGVLEDERIPLEHACLSCAVREDALPTLARLAADGRWTGAVLALPLSAESLPATRAIAAATQPGGLLARAHVATVAALVDLATFEADLLDAETLGERGLALTEDDERSVGEALAAQVEHADLVVTVGERSMAPTGSGLLDRLRAADSHRLDGLHGLGAARLLGHRHDTVRGERRAHPLGARGPLRGPLLPGDLSWTLELTSRRPLHPERLLEQIEALGTGRVRSRGVFQVADRPGTACHWDGAGGQLYIGDLGPWVEACAGNPEQSRLVLVGAADDEDPLPRLHAAFEAALLTDSEMADGALVWIGRDDALAPWLGERAVR
ncbi:GTP-binding protein [Antribacter gilvus]|uniref:GTP-binding protein n=1 Tax=Antribacter gilvus TaxID=2304675 RepID=UPI000F7850F4|nr:GTP-binding protein [Antribacter gilvus]